MQLKILFYMDPIVHRGDLAKVSAFNARYNLSAEFLGKEASAQSGLDIRFFCSDEVSDLNDIKTVLAEQNISLHTVSVDEMETLLRAHNLTHEQVVSETGGIDEFALSLGRVLRRKFGDEWQPDLVIGWENTPNYLSEIFPNSIYLEGHHSGFYRLSQQRDVLFRLAAPKSDYYSNLSKALHALDLPRTTLAELDEYRSTFQRLFTKQPNIDRETLDPAGKFRKLLFYPGHLPTFRRSMYAHAGDDQVILRKALESTPSDVAIVYSPHPLSSTLGVTTDLIQNDRIIDVSALQKSAPNISVNILDHVDAVLNISSNFAIPAMLLKKPVFDFGGSWLSDYAFGRSYDELKDWVQGNSVAEQVENYEKAAANLVWYVLTRKVPIKFLQASGVILQYYEQLHRNVLEKDVLEWLPVFNSVRGATFELEQSQFKNAGHLNSPASRFGLEQYFIRGAIMNPNVEAVGFDIFDTMLCRPTAAPVDLFDTIGPYVKKLIKLELFDFKATRVAAEDVARKHNKARKQNDVTLNEIYAAFQQITGFETAQIEAIRDIELAAESRALRPRYSVRALFDLARLYNKKILVISDMYLSSDFLRSTLEAQGYDGIDHLFVSNEHNAFKRSGELYRIALRAAGVEPGKVVFLGDNFPVDVEAAKTVGLNAFHYPKAIEKFQKTRAATDVLPYYLKGAHYCFHIGQVANRLYDDPFLQVDINTLFNRSSYFLGYFVFGPLVLSNAVWLANHIEKGQYQRLFFAARDGYLVQKAYDLLNEHVYSGDLAESRYYYASRKASIKLYVKRALIPSLLDVYKAHPNATVSYYLTNFFGINADDEQVQRKFESAGIKLAEGLYRQRAAFIVFLIDNLDWFRGLIADTSIVEYTEQEIGEIERHKTAFYDVGTRATTQKLLSMDMGHPFDIFLMRQVKYKLPESQQISAYLMDKASPYIPGIAAVSAGLSEILLSCPYDESVSDYRYEGGEWKPVLERQKLTYTQNVQVEAQRGVVEFCQDFITLFGDSTRYMNEAGTDVFIAPLEYLSSFPTERDFLEKLEFSNPLWLPGNFNIRAPRTAEQVATQARAASLKPAKEPKSKMYLRYYIFGSKKNYQKFLDTPHKFFAESKSPFLRQLRHFYR